MRKETWWEGETQDQFATLHYRLNSVLAVLADSRWGGGGGWHLYTESP